MTTGGVRCSRAAVWGHAATVRVDVLPARRATGARGASASISWATARARLLWVRGIGSGSRGWRAGGGSDRAQRLLETLEAWWYATAGVGSIPVLPPTSVNEWNSPSSLCTTKNQWSWGESNPRPSGGDRPCYDHSRDCGADGCPTAGSVGPGGPPPGLSPSQRSFPPSAVFPAVILRFCCRAAVDRPRAALRLTMSLYHLDRSGGESELLVGSSLLCPV